MVIAGVASPVSSSHVMYGVVLLVATGVLGWHVRHGTPTGVHDGSVVTRSNMDFTGAGSTVLGVMEPESMIDRLCGGFAATQPAGHVRRKRKALKRCLKGAVSTLCTHHGHMMPCSRHMMPGAGTPCRVCKCMAL